MNNLKNIIIHIAFYMSRVIDITFLSSFLIVVFVNLIYDKIPTYLGYWFWFILGVYICRLANYYGYNFLRKSYYENNQYYMKLLEKAEKKRKEKNQK